MLFKMHFARDDTDSTMIIYYNSVIFQAKKKDLIFSRSFLCLYPPDKTAHDVLQHQQR